MIIECTTTSGVQYIYIHCRIHQILPPLVDQKSTSQFLYSLNLQKRFKLYSLSQLFGFCFGLYKFPKRELDLIDQHGKIFFKIVNTTINDK